MDHKQSCDVFYFERCDKLPIAMDLMPSCWLFVQGETHHAVVGDRARSMWGHCAWYPLCQGHLSSLGFEPSEGLAH